MFTRLILKELEEWSAKTPRKPLVIRGARQVGKTTVVTQLGSQFEQYIYMNLELEEDKKPFLDYSNLDNLIQALFFLKNKSLQQKNNTLLFIDEIQEVPEALTMLRYFFEQEPGIAVIAAGSLLETLFNKDISFPVGRIEYKVMRPVSFPEFLSALAETAALEQLLKVPVAKFTHDKLLQLFHTYALIGGMPEIINHYAQHKDLTALSPIYDSLISGYMDDVEKYAVNASQVLHIRHVIRSSFSQAGKRIKFEGFGNSTYRSREMGESLRTLEKTMLLQLIYPNTSATLPLMADIRKSPRLQILDTGMLNYFVGLQKEILSTENLNSIYQGKMIEHLAGQELLAFQYQSLSSLYFWAREKNQSSAEVDFLFPYNGKLIPVEVKSGADGKLKSLHIFMDMAPHNMALRFYAGELNITEPTTVTGKKFYLLNLPYYLISQLKSYLPWFENQIAAQENLES